MSEISIRRYTSLPILLDILNRKCLTLLDPQSWDDKNDSHFIMLYKKKQNLKSVLALCFANTSERYHLWKIYAGGICGVGIEFNYDNLQKNYIDIEGFRSDSVKYKLVQNLKKDNLEISQLPFLKRWAFNEENEYRIIYESSTEEITSKDISISIDSISRIIFNPWIPISVFESIKAVIKKIDGCNSLRIERSDLIDTERWKRIGEEILVSLTATSDQKHP
jgi:hypothetical protein